MLASTAGDEHLRPSKLLRSEIFVGFCIHFSSCWLETIHTEAGRQYAFHMQAWRAN
jgi:hypothetical protein